MSTPTLFIGYAHQDEVWKDRLVDHLKAVGLEGDFVIWDDRRVEAGEDWLAALENALEEAEVAVLLITPSFLASGFLRGTELPQPLQRRGREGMRVIPLVVDPSRDEEQIDSDLAALAEGIAGFAHRKREPSKAPYPSPSTPPSKTGKTSVRPKGSGRRSSIDREGTVFRRGGRQTEDELSDDDGPKEGYGRPIEERPEGTSSTSGTSTQDSGSDTEEPGKLTAGRDVIYAGRDVKHVRGNGYQSQGDMTFSRTSDVLVTTVTPEGVRPGARFQVEVHFHLEGIEIVAAPGHTAEREVANLTLQEGATLTVRLVPVDDGTFQIDDPQASFRWKPPARNVDFRLRAAKDLEDGIYDLRVEYWCGEVQLARTYLEIEVSKDAAEPRRGRSVARRRLPRSAFASYSRLDRVRVLERIDSLKAVGIDVFLDCLDIKPAEDWQAVLEKEIRGRDTLLLFWSTAAAGSEWVDKEWRYALHERGADHILPNALEPPMRCPPPAELAHLHFGSVLIELAETWRQDDASA